MTNVIPFAVFFKSSLSQVALIFLKLGTLPDLDQDLSFSHAKIMKSEQIMGVSKNQILHLIPQSRVYSIINPMQFSKMILKWTQKELKKTLLLF